MHMVKNDSQGIFSASFDQSYKFVSKSKHDMNITIKVFMKNYFRSNSLLKIVGVSFIGIFFFGTWLYAFGVFLPSEFAHIEKIKYFNYKTIRDAGAIAEKLTIVPIIFECFLGGVFVYAPFRRLFPDYSLKNVMCIAIPQGILMVLLLFVALFPLNVGLAISGSGILGFLFQIVIVIYFLYKTLVNIRHKILKEFYSSKYDRIIKSHLKLRRVILFVFMIVIFNSYLFRIGMTSSFDVYQLFYSWFFLITSIGTTFCIKIVFPKMIAAFYIVKYSEKYKEVWNLSDEQWYGKRRAKKLAKKKIKQERKGK